MKILLVQETDWLKRNPVQHHHMVEKLSLRGHRVRVIDYELLWRTTRTRELYSRRGVSENVCKIYQGASVTVIRPGIIKLPLLEYLSLLFSHKKEIRRQIEDFSPDVIVGLSILNSYLASREAKKRNIPFIYYWLDILHLLIPFKPFRLFGKLVEIRTLKQADKVLVINDKLKDYVLGMGAPPGRTRVLKPGVDLEQFNPAVDGDNIRRQYGFDKQDVVLFFMGWLYQFSGLKEVALQLAKTQNYNLKLLIVGEGDIYEELIRIREEHNLKDRVILAGRKPYEEVPNFIAAADICLLPAYPWEPIMQDIVPIKLYEYMAMKKPVIATRLPGVMREFGDDNGVVYIENPEDVVGKAIQLLQNGSLEKLGSRARSFVEKHSWDSITDEFEEILEETVEGKKQRKIPSLYR